MKFSAFIEKNLELILADWDASAEKMLPAAAKMSPSQLRDHAREVLLAIARDMETRQTEEQRAAKSQGERAPATGPQSAASTHGASRLTAGFDLVQLVHEFRALRASVLKFWSEADVAGAAKPAAEEIARFHEALDQALAESVERYSAESAKSRDIFLAVLGHDVRGPLSGIRLAADALLTPSLPDAMRTRLVMRIRRAVDTIARLSTDLLQYTRSRLGDGIPVERSSCDLALLCADAVEAVQASHPAQQFTQELSGNLVLDCDRARMEQVLVNLLHNAVEHGDPSLPVSIEAAEGSPGVVLKVHNFGAPIPSDSLGIIFEPLVQISRPKNALHGHGTTGVGLGLFIVSEIVDAHQGKIAVQSTATSGTVFTVTLPRLTAA